MKKLINAGDKLFTVSRMLTAAKFDKVISKVSKEDLCLFFNSSDVLRGNDGWMYFVDLVEEAIIDDI